MVALEAPKLRALRRRLGAAAEHVEFADMGDIGHNPACIIPAWRDFVAGRSGSMRGVGEPIWPGRTPDELVECQCHEALLNTAFADTAGFHLLCPYDSAHLGRDVIEEAERSHPWVGATESVRYRGDAGRAAAALRAAPARARRSRPSTASCGTTWATSARSSPSTRSRQASPSCAPATSSSPRMRSPPTASATAAARASCASGTTTTPWSARSATAAGSTSRSPAARGPSSSPRAAGACGWRTSCATSSSYARCPSGNVVRLHLRA